MGRLDADGELGAGRGAVESLDDDGPHGDAALRGDTPMRWTHDKMARLGITLRPEDDLSRVRVWTKEGKRLLSELSEADLVDSMRHESDAEDG